MTKSMTVTRPYDTRGNSEGSRDNSQNDSCRKVDDGELGFAGVKVTLLLVGLQSIFIVLFGVFLRYNVQAMPNFPVRTVLSLNTNGTNDSMGGTTIVYEIDEGEKAAHDLASKEHIPINYAIYQDVHVMMFVGFGFLMTFLYRYGLSSVAYNFLLGAMCIQWATLTDGWIRRLRLKDDYYILVNINTMIDNDFAVATALIGFGAVLGKVNLLQLTVMGFLQIALYQVNCLFVYDLLKADDPGCSLVVHTFGAYFGLTVARIIHKKEVVSEAEKKESSVYHSDIFSMIGTLFLWTLYPSFNAATAVDEGRIRAIINTYFSLCASVMTAFAMTNLVCKGKFNMVHVQNSTLAGGVAVGTMAQMIIQPWGAVLIGSVAGVVSVLGFQFVQPALRKYLGIHDTCGVHNLHGMPGLIAGFGSVLAGGVATWGKYGDGRLKIFGLNGERTLGQQAGYQAAAIATSLGTALIGGAITGIILRLPIWDQPRYEQIMDDSPRWVSVVDIPPLSISNNDDKSKSIEDFRYIGDSKKNSIAVTEFSTESS